MSAPIAEGPPFHLPWRYFVGALALLPLGLGTMAVNGPALAAAPHGPAALAGVHLLALGWIAPVVFGALTQMLPVVLGVPLRGAHAFACAHVALLAGALGLAAGFTFAPALLPFGGAAAAAGLLAALLACGATLLQVKSWNLTSRAIALALGFALAGALLGGALLLNRYTGFAPWLFGAMPLHAHALVVGWLSVLTIGLSYHLMPMFTLAHGHPERGAKLALGGLGLGTLACALPLVAPAWWPAAAALLGAGALVYAFDMRRLLARRQKRRLDAGLGLAASAPALLPLLVALGVGAAAGVPGCAASYGYLLLAGWLSWSLLGYLYKIVPFIVWSHRFGAPGAGGRRPLASALVSARLARWASRLLRSGVLGYALGLGTGHAGLLYAAGALATAGAALAAFDLLASLYRQGESPCPSPTTPS